MAATMRLGQTTDIVETLKGMMDLLQLCSNPEALRDAYATAIKEVELVQEEVDRIEALRVFLAEQEGLLLAYKTKEETLCTQEKEHALTVERAADELTDKKAQLVGFETELKQKEEAIDKRFEELQQADKNLETLCREVDSRTKKTQQSLEAYEAKLVRWEESLVGKQAQLSQESALLREKAAQLKSIMGS